MKFKSESRRGTLLVAAIGLTLGLTGGVAAGSAVTGPSDEPGPGGSGKFSKNAKGMTYGPATESLSPDKEPDLIKAYATNGKIGYVLKQELEDVLPSPGSS